MNTYFKQLCFKKICYKTIFAGLLFTAAASSDAAGLLKPANSPLPDLTIKEHHVDVTIQSGYVTTEIEQVFHNPNAEELEAIYSFPVPEQAAVRSCRETKSA